MKRYAGYAALLIGAWLVFLLWQLPAAQVAGHVQSSGAMPLALHQVEGTLWRGSAGTVVAGGQVAGPLNWTFRPLALFTGRIEADIVLTVGEGNRIDAVAGRGLDGAPYLRNARATLPLNELALLAGQPDMGLDGRVGLDLQRVRLDANGGIAAIEGRADITGAGIGAPVNVTLGNFTVEIETAEQVIRAMIRDREAPLQTDGVIVLNPDGRYRLNATLSVRDPANTQLAQAISMLGRPDRNGRVAISQQGRIVLPHP